MQPWSIDAVDIRDVEDIDPGLLVHTSAVDEFLADDSPIRIVVAPKGFGKTLLLKMKRHEMTGRADCIPSGQMVDVPAGAVQLDSSKADLLSDAQNWELLWSTAIGIAVLKQASKAPSLPSNGDELKSNELKALWNEPLQRTPSEVLLRLVNRIEPKEFFQGLQVDFVETLAPTLRTLRSSIAVFIDNIDECFAEHLNAASRPTGRGRFAREVWLQAQIGLLRTAYQFGRMNPKLKIYATVRHEAMRQLAGEMSVQHRGITIELAYTRQDLDAIFRRNAEKEPPTHRVSQDKPDPVHAFLGLKRVTHSYVRTLANARATESIESYIYRHTFGRPRDLMVIGRGLAEVNPSHRDNQAVRRVVNTRAHMLAAEYIAESRPHISFDVADFVSGVDSNVITSSEAREACSQYSGVQCTTSCAECPADVHPLCTLYALGLVGWVDEDFPNRRKIQRFLKAGEATPEEGCLPESDHYLVHPALEDYLRRGDPTYKERLYKHAIIGDGLVWRDAIQESV